MECDVTWCDASTGAGTSDRRLAQCEAVLSLVSTGVIILEPDRDDSGASLRTVMVNDLAACYFGRIGTHAEPLVDTIEGLDDCGLLGLAVLVSLTGQPHMHEGLAAPGPAATGHVVDVAITPLENGAVAITFDDVTHRLRL